MGLKLLLVPMEKVDGNRSSFLLSDGTRSAIAHNIVAELNVVIILVWIAIARGCRSRASGGILERVARRRSDLPGFKRDRRVVRPSDRCGGTHGQETGQNAVG